MRTGQRQIEDEEHDKTNTTSKETIVTVEGEEVSESTKALKTLRTTVADLKKNDIVDDAEGQEKEINTNQELVTKSSLEKRKLQFQKPLIYLTRM